MAEALAVGFDDFHEDIAAEFGAAKGVVVGENRRNAQFAVAPGLAHDDGVSAQIAQPCVIDVFVCNDGEIAQWRECGVVESPVEFVRFIGIDDDASPRVEAQKKCRVGNEFELHGGSQKIAREMHSYLAVAFCFSRGNKA